MTALRTTIDEYVDAYFRFRPGEATEKGYAKYDQRVPSFAPDDVAQFRAAVQRAREAVGGIDLKSTPIDADEALDLAALKAHLETALFDIDRLGTLTVNPATYVLAALDPVEALELQDKRGPALIARLSGIPALLAQAAAQIDAPAEPFRDVALEMLTSGIEHLGESYAHGPVDPAVAEAADEARRAMDRYAEHLTQHAGDARPFAPMGEENYLFLLANEHLLEDGLDPILALAHQTYAQVGEELAKLESDEEDDEEIAIPDNFGWQDVLNYYHEELQLVRRFVEEKQLITIPEGTILLRETPEYMRALIPGVSYLPTPAFSDLRRGYLYVRPVPREMDDEDREEFWERVHYRWFRNTIAHEVWPGHHVQLLRAAEHPSAIRKFRDNDVMVEGWGLYSESLVREQGMWEGSPPRGSLRALGFRAMRVIIDVGIHTGRFTLEGAVDWVIEQIGARAGEGMREWMTTEVRRYATEPTQAMSYLVGQKMIHDLREEWSAMAGRDQQSLQRFHNEFVGEGSLPIPLIRKRMLERVAKPGVVV